MEEHIIARKGNREGRMRGEMRNQGDKCEACLPASREPMGGSKSRSGKVTTQESGWVGPQKAEQGEKQEIKAINTVGNGVQSDPDYPPFMVQLG